MYLVDRLLSNLHGPTNGRQGLQEGKFRLPSHGVFPRQSDCGTGEVGPVTVHTRSKAQLVQIKKDRAAYTDVLRRVINWVDDGKRADAEAQVFGELRQDMLALLTSLDTMLEMQRKLVIDGASRYR